MTVNVYKNTYCYGVRISIAPPPGIERPDLTFIRNSRFQPCRIAVNSSGATPGQCSDGTNNGNVVAITLNLAKNTPGQLGDRQEFLDLAGTVRIAEGLTC